MNSLPAIFGVILLALGPIHAASQDDLITNLPGLPSQPSFKQYSGYLQALGTRKLHYWFLESSSNPAVDPVVLWMNGGPGCSSMDGLLAEHGPFRINDDGRTLTYNVYAWNQVANMIYLEAPAGVGYSYADDGNYTINDDETAANNLAALKDFFTKFPELKKNDFYITGESYAGVYVPTLTSHVLDDGSINIKGFAVGNGLLDRSMNENSIIKFAYYHGLIGEKLWRSAVENCCPNNVSDNCNFSKRASMSESCGSDINRVQEIVWSDGLDPYNLYSDCPSSSNSLHYDSTIGKFVSHNIMNPFSFLPKNIKEDAFIRSLPSDSILLSPPCINSTAMTVYLNSPEVRKALHIPAKVRDWQICRKLAYEPQYSSVATFFKKALAHTPKLRVLVYNGDVDMACNFLGNEWFVDSLPLKNPQERTFWHYKNKGGSQQVAGFVKAFDQLTYITVKGAGHMVPSDKPIPALEMFINFIQDRPF